MCFVFTNNFSFQSIYFLLLVFYLFCCLDISLRCQCCAKKGNLLVLNILYNSIFLFYFQKCTILFSKCSFPYIFHSTIKRKRCIIQIIFIFRINFIFVTLNLKLKITLQTKLLHENLYNEKLYNRLYFFPFCLIDSISFSRTKHFCSL